MKVKDEIERLAKEYGKLKIVGSLLFKVCGVEGR
jgi:hypothetical protein